MWRFPPVKFIKTNTVGQQIYHVTSEAFELVTTYLWYKIGFGKYERVLEEAADLYHSVESLWRVFLRKGVDVHKEWTSVVIKNQVRDYYDE
jgi:hypothetical protein